MRLLIASILACCVVGAAGGGEPAADSATLYKRLHDSAQAEDAFAALATTFPKAIKKPALQPTPTFFVSATPTFVRQESGSEIAVVSIQACRSGRCGNGIFDGGISSPNILNEMQRVDRLISIDDSGTLIRFISVSDRAAIVDAAEVGKENELVRWATYTNYDRCPYLIIHDLTKPNFPAMLNIAFNPHMTEWDYHYRTDDDGIFITPGPDSPRPDPPHATRFCRWSFVAGKFCAYRDVLIEEKKGDAYVEVARFVFDAKARCWVGPKGSDDDVWKIATDAEFRAHFKSAFMEDYAVYKKYIPPATATFEKSSDGKRPLDPNDE